MLRFSLRRKQPASPQEPFPGDEGVGSPETTTHVNRSSSAWLAFRKRTISVESVSSLFNSIGRGSDSGALPRRESQNSMSGASVTGGNNAKLMRSHKMQTKSGQPIEVFFGYESLTVDGRAVSYNDVVYWSHSASHWKLTFISPSSGKRRELILYPIDKDKGPLPSDLTELIELRLARLVKDRLGCTTERALRLTTKEASEGELQEALVTAEGARSVDRQLGKSPDDDTGGVILEEDEHLVENTTSTPM